MKPQHPYKIPALSVLAASLIAANAQAKSQAPVLIAPKLEEVRVTATRSSSLITELPYSLAVVDKQEQLLQQVRSLPEALANIPGVRIQKTANGQGSPFIRGFTGYRTLALIDGVRYNNSVYRDGPNEYFALIDFAGIEQIELLNGPASALYGSDAIGGSLNLSSQQPKFEQESGRYWGGQQQLRYSSAEQSRISRSQIDLGQGGDWGLLAGLSIKDFGQVKAAGLGELPTTDYQEQAFDARLDKKLNPHWQLTALHQDLRQDDVWRTHSTIYSQPYAGTEAGTDLRRLKDQQRQLSYLKLQGQDLQGALRGAADTITATLSRQHWREDSERVRSNNTAIQEYFASTMWGLDIQLGRQGESSQWVYGLDVYQDQVNSGRLNFAADGSLESVSVQGPVGDDASHTQAGAYVQAELDLAEDWQLSLGSRYSWVQAKIGRFADPISDTAISYSNSWNNLSSSVRLKYQTNRQHQVWAGVSQSFRAPNIADISRYGKSRSSEIEVAALALAPEKFLSYELGWRWQASNSPGSSSSPANTGWQLSSNVFYTDIKDYINSTPTGNIREGLIEVSKQNTASGFMHGLEINARYRFNPNWHWQASYSWAKGKQQLADGAKSYFSRTMPAEFSSRLDWHSDDGQQQVSLNLSHSAKAKRLSAGDLDDLERIAPGGTAAYTLLDISSRWALQPQLELLIKLNNLTDQAYRSHGSGTNEPGRGITAGFNWAF